MSWDHRCWGWWKRKPFLIAFGKKGNTRADMFCFVCGWSITQFFSVPTYSISLASFSLKFIPWKLQCWDSLINSFQVQVTIYINMEPCQFRWYQHVDIIPDIIVSKHTVHRIAQIDWFINMYCFLNCIYCD